MLFAQINFLKPEWISLGKSEKAVLLSLCAYARDNGTGCYLVDGVSLTRLSKTMSMKRNSVSKATGNLETKKAINIYYKNGKENTYDVSFWKPPKRKDEKQSRKFNLIKANVLHAHDENEAFD